MRLTRSHLMAIVAVYDGHVIGQRPDGIFDLRFANLLSAAAFEDDATRDLDWVGRGSIATWVRLIEPVESFSRGVAVQVRLSSEWDGTGEGAQPEPVVNGPISYLCLRCAGSRGGGTMVQSGCIDECLQATDHNGYCLPHEYSGPCQSCGADDFLVKTLSTNMLAVYSEWLDEQGLLPAGGESHAELVRRFLTSRLEG